MPGAIQATLTLDSSPFIRSLASCPKSLPRDFARQKYEASLGVRGTTGVLAEAKAVDKAYDSLDGREVEVDVDPGGRGAARLGTAFRRL